MNIPLGIGLNGFDGFLLILVRMTGLFVAAPIFGRRNIPTYLKVGLSFMLALILSNTVSVKIPTESENIYSFAFMCAKEFIVGITIGYVSYLVYTGIYIAGQIIDMQIGFGMVNVLDPMSNIQIPVTANLYFMISMLVFLMVNGHHMLIRALFESYKYIPAGEAVFNNDLMNDIVRVFTTVFATGFKIAAPVVAAILIVDVALGIMSKTIPQMNVFILGMPLKIGIGIAVMIISIPVFVSFIDELRQLMSSELFNFITHMGPKG